MIIKDISDKTNLSDINKVNKLYYYLFCLQKRIYQASKEGHLSLVRSLQKLLLSLFSMNLLASSIVKNTIKLYPINRINDNNKLNNSFSFREIRKLLISWCLEAEWSPKLHTSIKERTHKLTYLFLTSCVLNTKIYLPSVDYIYLTNKLQATLLIKNSIQTFLIQDSFINYVSLPTNQFKFRTNKIDCLNYMLSSILLNGQAWLCFRQTKSVIPKSIKLTIFFNALKLQIYICTNKKILDGISNSIKNFLISSGYIAYNTVEQAWLYQYIEYFDFINKDSSSSLKYLDKRYFLLLKSMKDELYQEIKDLLFHKDIIGRLRINNRLTVRDLMFQIKQLIIVWQYHYLIFGTKQSLYSVKQIILEICYYWLRKKYMKNSRFELKARLSWMRFYLNTALKL